MNCSKLAAAAMLAFSILVLMGYSVSAQQDGSERRIAAKCTAHLRKCNSHCNLVYESKRALRVCRNRCEDSFAVCKTQHG